LSEEERYLEGTARQQFTDCYIEGSVDFIFGCGEARFSDCHIHSVYDGREVGYVAAPSDSLKQSEGFLFQNCRLTGDERLNGKVFLARPWRDFGKAVFLDCDLGAHISLKGFDPWNDSGRERTARFSYGGVNNSQEFVSWSVKLSEEEAERLRIPKGGTEKCL
jgi:pectinesterase